MSAPIRTTSEIAIVINNGQQSLADITNTVIKQKKHGQTIAKTSHRDNVYRMVLLWIYLQNILEPNGDVHAYYLTSDNEKKFNKILDGIVALSYGFQGPAIPLLGTLNIPLIIYNIGGSSVVPAPPSAGVVSISATADSPSTVVDSINANSRGFAFWIIKIRGVNSSEGSRTAVIVADWNGSSVTWEETTTGDNNGNTTPVTFTVELNGGNIELVVNTSTDGWIVTGRRI